MTRVNISEWEPRASDVVALHLSRDHMIVTDAGGKEPLFPAFP
jgi:hypothetical protein